MNVTCCSSGLFPFCSVSTNTHSQVMLALLAPALEHSGGHLMKCWSRQAAAQVLVCACVCECSLIRLSYGRTAVCWCDYKGLARCARQLSVTQPLFVFVCVGGVSGGMRQHFVGAGSDLTPPLTRAFLKAASGCLLCPCDHVLMCPGIRLAYNIVFIQHFPFHRHFSPLGKHLCVFVMETENVVAVLIWSCSLVLSEWVRYRMNQSAVTSEVWAGGMDYLASYWNTHFHGEWERERGMTAHACICILRCPTFLQHRDIGTVM